MLSDTEFKILNTIDSWQRVRRYRFGLNRRYVARRVGVDEEIVNEVVDKLIAKGLLWVLHKYGHEYLFLTKRGRLTLLKEKLRRGDLG